MRLPFFVTLVTLCLGVPAFANEAALREAALQLSTRHNCAACHAVDRRLMGPSWQEIGRKYADDAEAEARLVRKARRGGVGVWGQLPMPANVTVREEDIRVIVRWALSQR
jgi:cytochrome c